MIAMIGSERLKNMAGKTKNLKYLFKNRYDRDFFEDHGVGLDDIPTKKLTDEYGHVIRPESSKGARPSHVGFGPELYNHRTDGNYYKVNTGLKNPFKRNKKPNDDLYDKVVSTMSEEGLEYWISLKARSNGTVFMNEDGTYRVKEGPNYTQDKAGSSGHESRSSNTSTDFNFDNFMKYDLAKSGMNTKLLDNWYNHSMLNLSEQSKQHQENLKAFMKMQNESSKTTNSLLKLNEKLYQEAREDRSAVLSYLEQKNQETIGLLISENDKNRKETSFNVKSLIDGYQKKTDKQFDVIAKLLSKYDQTSKKQFDTIKTLLKGNGNIYSEVNKEMKAYGRKLDSLSKKVEKVKTYSPAKAAKKTVRKSTVPRKKRQSQIGLLREIRDDGKKQLKNQETIIKNIDPGLKIRTSEKVEEGPLDDYFSSK